VSTHHAAHRQVNRGRIGTALRLLNRLGEGWLRQFVSWRYQWRGFIVVYDRHFLFDAASSKKHRQLADRFYYWILSYLYPQPDLVIFLDAPPEILFARKGEATVRYLQERREAYLSQGKKTTNFIQVDAAQPLDKVYTAVSQHILEFHSAKNSQRAYSSK
jgi:thymidylate kinase